MKNQREIKEQLLHYFNNKSKNLGINLPKGTKDSKANFYKCGDNMPQKHYLSWHPIEIEKPNFHRPDHFGTLYFE